MFLLLPIRSTKLLEIARKRPLLLRKKKRAKFDLHRLRSRGQTATTVAGNDEACLVSLANDCRHHPSILDISDNRRSCDEPG